MPLELFAQKADDVLRLHNTHHAPLRIDHRQCVEIVLVEGLGQVVLPLLGGAGENARLGEHGEARLRLRHDEPCQGDNANQDAAMIEQIDLGYALGVAVEGAQRQDSLSDGGLRREIDKIGCHASGGAVLVKLKQLGYFLTLLRLHLFENGAGPLLRELGEQVGGRAGIHLFDDVGNLFLVQLLEQRLEQPGGNLLKGVGGDLFIERGKDGLPLGRGQVFENLGELRGVHLGQPFVFDAQLDAAGGVNLDDIDKLPGDAAGGEVAGERVELRTGQQTLEDAAEGSTEAHLDLGYTKQMSRSVTEPFEVNIIDAHHLAAVNIDNLAVDQVLLEKEVVTLVLEGSEVVGGTHLKGAGGGLHHLVGGNNKEPGTGLENKTSHLACIGAGGDSDVLEPASHIPLRIRYRSTEESGEADTGCGAGLHDVSVDRCAWICAVRIRKSNPALRTMVRAETSEQLDRPSWSNETAMEVPQAAEPDDPVPDEEEASAVTNPRAGRLSFALSSTMESVGEVEAAAEKLATEAGLDEDQRFHLTMAVREAAVNAVLHGNDYDPDKKISASFENTGKSLVITIADEGIGLDPETIPDPLAPENLMRGTGRGIFLIRSLMDEVHFRKLNPGTELTLVKHLKAPEETNGSQNAVH